MQPPPGGPDSGLSASSGRRPLRILLVEDNFLLASLFAEMLVDLGHDVCAIAANKQAAIDAAFTHVPDLMLVDDQLGCESGVSAVEEILQIAHIAHVFVTGDLRSVIARRPNAIVIQKPFLEAHLIAAMERALAAS